LSVCLKYVSEICLFVEKYTGEINTDQNMREKQMYLWRRREIGMEI
jgi:hypothetical protein